MKTMITIEIKVDIESLRKDIENMNDTINGRIDTDY